MNYTIKNLSGSRKEIRVEYSAEEFRSLYERALAELAKQVRVEGFRPGKAPKELAARNIKEGVLLEEAANRALSRAWREVLSKESIDAVGEPSAEVRTLALGSPFEFAITCAVVPTLELPDYKALAAKTKKKPIVVDEAEVDKALEWLRANRKAEDGTVPELSDEFAKTVGGFEHLAALRESVREGMREEKLLKESQRARQEVLVSIASRVRAEIPDVLIEREKRAMLENTKQSATRVLGMPFEDYLKKLGKTEDQLLDSFTERALERVKEFLVVREIAKKESIVPTQEEIEAEMNHIFRHYSSEEEAKKQLDLAQLRTYTESVLVNEKTLQFLEHLVSSD